MWCGQFRFTQTAKLFGEENSRRRGDILGANWSTCHRDGSGWLRTGRARVGNQWRNLFQLWFFQEIGGDVRDLGQGAQSRFGRTYRRGRERRIFGIDPAEKGAAFLGIWCDERDPCRRRHQSHRRRINNLKYIKAKRVQDRRSRDKTDDRDSARSRWSPIK